MEVTKRLHGGASIHIYIILVILLRLPVKSLLRFKVVCKEWHSLINTQLFINHYLEKSITTPFARTALLIYTQRRNPGGLSKHCKLFSASLSGCDKTMLTTFPSIPSHPNQALLNQVEHVNGLILFHHRNGYVGRIFAYIVNPSTRGVYKVPSLAPISDHAQGNAHICYFFDFDPICNDFKILCTRLVGLIFKPNNITIQCGVFSLRTGSWKNIDPVFPFDILSDEWLEAAKRSVCVSGKIHIMLRKRFAIATFDLREGKFFIKQLPQGAIPSEVYSTLYAQEFGRVYIKYNYPYLLNWKGLLAVVCHEHLIQQHKSEVWILKDYENHVWVMETLTLPCSWMDFGRCMPTDVIVTGEIMFTPWHISRECQELTFYCVKTKRFRVVKFPVSFEFSLSYCLGYVESIWPLKIDF